MKDQSLEEERLRGSIKGVLKSRRCCYIEKALGLSSVHMRDRQGSEAECFPR